ncbi:MAG TPA: hypothetical protein VNG33_23560 [Polyangiaceae bacterium]|nr:hypothetical protein [Polyangiaceae bacterium]
MGGVALIRGIQQITIEDASARGGLAIVLGQPRVRGVTPTARWKFEVRAHVPDGEFLVGVFSTCPPHDNSPKTRAVAMASCPGAIAWTLKVTPWPSSLEFAGMVYASIGDPSGQAPGVVRVGERSKQYSGVAAGAVAIPAGERVIAWSAFSTAAGATVQIDQTIPAIVGSPIPIPNGGSASGGDAGLLNGPLLFTFAGAIGGYLIETAESA